MNKAMEHKNNALNKIQHHVYLTVDVTIPHACHAWKRTNHLDWLLVSPEIKFFIVVF